MPYRCIPTLQLMCAPNFCVNGADLIHDNDFANNTGVDIIIHKQTVKVSPFEIYELRASSAISGLMLRS